MQKKHRLIDGNESNKQTEVGKKHMNEHYVINGIQCRFQSIIIR